jgi:uncharacterized membrane protein
VEILMKKRTAIVITFIFIFGYVFLGIAQAYAIGVGVAPDSYNLTLKRGETTNVELGVTNTGQTESVYEVYIDDEEYERLFSIKPDKFTIPAKGAEMVDIKIKAPLIKTGALKTNIAVVSLEKNEGLGVGAGIKVPVKIEVTSQIALSVIIIGIVIVVVIAAVITAFIMYRRRRIA